MISLQHDAHCVLFIAGRASRITKICDCCGAFHVRSAEPIWTQVVVAAYDKTQVMDVPEFPEMILDLSRVDWAEYHRQVDVTRCQ